MWQLFILTFLLVKIQFDQVWSKSDPKKIKNKITIFILMVNVTTVYSNNFWLVKIQFDQVWSVLDRSDPKNYFYSNIFWLVRNPIWSSLIHFGQIWSIKIQNKTAIFILSVNVTTFYSNIFRLVRKSNLIKFDQVWSILDRSDPKKSKMKRTFLSFLKMWQLCILTFFDMWNH